MKVELLAIAFLAAVSSAGIVTKESTPTCGPDEFECPNGCCPVAYFSYCCTHGPFEDPVQVWKQLIAQQHLSNCPIYYSQKRVMKWKRRPQTVSLVAEVVVLLLAVALLVTATNQIVHMLHIHNVVAKFTLKVNAIIPIHSTIYF